MNPLYLFKRLIFSVLLIGNMATWAQNNVRSYSYWFDNDVTGMVTTFIDPAPHYTFDASLATAGISTGIHSFNIRFMDDSSHASGVISRFFFKAPVPGSEAKEIVEISYWYDNDISGMSIQPIGPGQQILINSDLDVTGLSTGIHAVNIRFKDNAGIWSSPASQFFFKAPVSQSEVKEIVEISYWYDNNIAEMITQAVGPAQQISINTDLDVNDLSTGIHSVNVRFKDNAGIWSSPLSQFFFKAPALDSENREIIAFQYWVDNAFSNANYQTVSPDQSFYLSNLVDLDTLAGGFHIIHAQFLDNSKLWSSPVSSRFYKPIVNGSNDNFVTACKYWFDEDTATLQEIYFTDPVNPRTLLMDVDMTGIWKGEHRLHVQFQDSLNLWGAVSTDTVFKNPLPVAVFTCESSFCFGDTVHFTNSSVDADSYFWDFGDGTSSTDSIPEFHVYAEPGDYTVSLKVTDLGTGIDSTATQVITMHEIPLPGLSLSGAAEFCEGGSVDISAMPGMIYEWSTGETTQTITVNTSGSYFASIYNGMNSACWVYSDTVIITVFEVDTTTMEAMICNGEVYTFGSQTITESGDYTEVFTAITGCDSIVNLSLIVTVIDTSVTVNFPSLTANLDNAVYTWVDCNTGYSAISGANQQSYTPGESGSYAVILEKDFCTDTSSCYQVNLTGIENTGEKPIFTVSPNPTSGMVNIQTGQKAEVTVIDGLGNKMYEAVLPKGQHSLNLMNKPKGMYIIVFTSQSQTKQVKLIKSN